MLISYIRTLVLYLVLIFVVRTMGKRQVGQMEPAEFVVTMLVADLAAIPIQNSGIPLYSGLVPILTVLGLELVLSGLMMRSIPMRRLLCGRPVILIENGHLLQDNLRAARISLDELTGHLREKDVLDLKTVQYAILETNGNLSVFPFTRDAPATAKEAGIHPKGQSLPVTIIEDGYVSRENLTAAGKDGAWLERVLQARRVAPEEVFLLTVDGSDQIFWIRKEGKA